MLAWMMRWVIWIAIRVAVTLACILTIQNVIHAEGYRVEFFTLVISAVCVIVAVRMWMPSSNKSEGE
jgi:hypothetical protein